MQETSLESYREVKKTLGKRQKEVMDVFNNAHFNAHPAGFTNSEIADFLGWGINRVTPRVLELRKQGLLELNGIRKCRVTGRRAMVWIGTECMINRERIEESR